MTATASLERDDPSFEDDLEVSKETVWQVARYLSDRGHSVQVFPTLVRKKADDRHRFGDHGDMGVLFKVEVKRRRIQFTNASDYPYATIFVDVAHKIDPPERPAWAYFLINRDGTHAAVVLGATREKWRRVERFDRTKNRIRTFYEAPKEIASFIRM